MDVVKGNFQGIGFPKEMAMVVLPEALFMVNSDLTPIRQNIDKFVDGLTKWAPVTKKKGIAAISKMKVQGSDYQDAVDKMNLLFMRNLTGDGLPLVPPTKERVGWILQGTDLPADREIGAIAPRGGIATVEVIATSLAMAGGRPEYLPVLIAAVQALIKPECTLQNWTTGSSNAFPVVVVNGPVAKQIRLNSGIGLLGPQPQYSAGAAIGRAIRLLLHNVGGAVPGIGAVGQYCPMRYTNAVFAEDEESFPKGWETLNSEYYGRPKGTNAVTTMVCDGAFNVHRRGSGIEPTQEAEQQESVYRVADAIKLTAKGPPGDVMAGVFIMNSLAASQMAAAGWTKATIKKALWELTRSPRSELLKRPDIVRDANAAKVDLNKLPDLVPMWDKPERIIIAVAGGRHPTSALWMPWTTPVYSRVMGDAEITLPAKAKWDALIKQAEKDLGP